jgi:hypothetical protein
VKALAADHVLFAQLDIEALDAKALGAEIARLIFAVRPNDVQDLDLAVTLLRIG